MFSFVVLKNCKHFIVIVIQNIKILITPMTTNFSTTPTRPINLMLFVAGDAEQIAGRRKDDCGSHERAGTRAGGAPEAVIRTAEERTKDEAAVAVEGGV